MKTKLWLLNIVFILFLTGLLLSISQEIQAGAIVILIGAMLASSVYFIQIRQQFQNSEIWSGSTFAMTLGLVVLAVVFVHGFAASIDMILVHRIGVFTFLYFGAGFVMVALFLYFSIKSVGKDPGRSWIIAASAIAFVLGFAGQLGSLQLIPVSARWIYYSWVFLLFFYVIFLLVNSVRGAQELRSERFKLLGISLLLLGFWLVRFPLAIDIPQGLVKAAFYFGLVPMLVLPLAIFTVRRLRSFVVFIFYFLFLEFYFIQFDANFKYLVDVGIHGCVDFEEAIYYPIINDPGVSTDDLFREPSQQEIQEIRTEWLQKDFNSQGIQKVYAEALPGGDSIHVISHLVDGQLHYGAIYLSRDLNFQQAPILMHLEGGGTGMDVSKEQTLTQGKCLRARKGYLQILPSYRGNVLRGKNFCFRSGGYPGDVWLGATHDAVAFLEAVKTHYAMPDSTPVVLSGRSRGATVALMIGALTDKVDYIIASSTHTKFLDRHVVQNERVGRSFGAAFYTPKATLLEMRRRLIASSPYYFAQWLPDFELHQGSEDPLTTVWHANVLQNQLEKLGKDKHTYNIMIYPGKGHGYDDDSIVCGSLRDFLQPNSVRN